ncbi:MAG TPA: hypothetical protein VG291_05670, partial [Xanthobacteraceae bacterium]|nr:hypothetical protein [Xanthobacteraceae bacterium]
AVLDKLDAEFRGATALQRNPHRKKSLKWAGWIIARLGGWDGYPSSKPPGPITFKMVSKNSMLWSPDGASEMCESPSARAEKKRKALRPLPRAIAAS